MVVGDGSGWSYQPKGLAYLLISGQGLDRVAELPPELACNILDQAGNFPIGLEEAGELRREMMDERLSFINLVDMEYEDRVFDLFGSPSL